MTQKRVGNVRKTDSPSTGEEWPTERLPLVWGVDQKLAMSTKAECVPALRPPRTRPKETCATFPARLFTTAWFIIAQTCQPPEHPDTGAGSVWLAPTMGG